MRWLSRLVFWFGLPLLPCAASHAMEPAFQCLIAAATAERKWALPSDMVAAIGRVESGRYDASTQHVLPWPWTVNADGAGTWFATRTDAVRFVHALQMRGIQLIDVGCFQIDLRYHPQAFTSLEEAFDPAANADYAARFLTSLHAETGSWPAAIARYHSGLAVAGESYLRQVITVWPLQAPPIDPRDARRPMPRGSPAPDSYVVLMSDKARSVQVLEPSR